MVDFFGPEELLHPPAPPCPIHPHLSAGHTQHREGSTGRMIPAGPRAGGKGGGTEGARPAGGGAAAPGPPRRAPGTGPGGSAGSELPLLAAGGSPAPLPAGPRSFPGGVPGRAEAPQPLRPPAWLGMLHLDPPARPAPTSPLYLCN